jgi:magnesium transporter
MIQSAPIEDDARERVNRIIKNRLPWLCLGLLGGIVATLLASQFEQLLQQNIHIAFFIPIIVYMADAVGTQTEAVYIRNMTQTKARFSVYLAKELLVGLSLGMCFGIIMGIVSLVWFQEIATALVIGLSMFVTVSIAPAIALLIPTILQKEHTDPAVTATPFTTIIQDLISLLLYFIIASVVLLH